MKKWVCFLALLTVAQMAGAQGLYENFANPPQEARPRVLSQGEARVQDLHRETVALVNAAFQAKAAEALADRLTEEELSYYKRGRNANSAHTPKNKSEAEYHRSTGFEALVGYLYLSRQFDRLRELFEVILQSRSAGSADQ